MTVQAGFRNKEAKQQKVCEFQHQLRTRQKKVIQTSAHVGMRNKKAPGNIRNKEAKQQEVTRHTEHLAHE